MKGACLVFLVAALGVITSATDSKDPPANYQPCFVDGQRYEHGKLTFTPYGHCRCFNGKPDCEKCPLHEPPFDLSANNKPCCRNGKWHESGPIFSDRCISCWCSNGLYACARMACHWPSSGIQPR